MKDSTRRWFMTLMIVSTLIWVVGTLVVFMLGDGFPDGWLLATIVLYAFMFVAALVLLFLTVPEAAPAPASSAVAAPSPHGPPHEELFATRRGAIEVDRTATRTDVALAEPGGALDLAQAEAALDRLQPASSEGAPKRRAAPSSRSPSTSATASPAPTGREAPA